MLRFTHARSYATPLFLIALLLCCSGLFAQGFSHILSFQGRLADTTGRPVPDGIYSVQLTIYDAETDGTALWTEAQGVTQVGGVFTAFLGMVTPFPSGLFSDGDRWLALRIVGDQEMAKRYRMAAAAFAIYSDNSDKVDGFHASATPTPSYILPLGTDGKFPLSAIPQGPGSGLNADLLDGLEGAAYVTRPVMTGDIADGAITSAKWKPTMGTICATGEVSLDSDGRKNVPGTQITLNPSVPSTCCVIAQFDMVNYDPLTTLCGFITVDGATKGIRAGQLIGPGPISCGILVAMAGFDLAPGPHTIKLTVEKNGTGTQSRCGILTGYTYWLASK